MPVQDYIITSDTRIKGTPVAKGTIIKLNPDNKEDLQTIGLLNHAGRITEATKENVEAINAELPKKSDSKK